MSEISCLFPLVIVSPTILHDALRSDRIVVNGHARLIGPGTRYELLKADRSPSSVLEIPYLESCDKDYVESHSVGDVLKKRSDIELSIENSYLVKDSTGEMFPVYVYVPCGHCDVCNSKKLSSLIQRAQFAMEESQRPASFVTLTYNRNHIPNDYRVRKRHIDLFKKNFKKNFGSLYARIIVPTIVGCELVDGDVIKSARFAVASKASKKVKFIVASEYGKKGRPHYHCMIFGLERLSSFDAEHDYFVRKLVQYCWRVPERNVHSGLYVDFDSYRLRYPRAVFKKGETPRPDEIDPLSRGFCNYQEVNVARCAKYILKYSFKQEKDDRPSFKSVSHHLGLQFVRQYSPKIEDFDGKFRYVSHFDLACKEVSLTSYFVRHIYPSFSKLVPSSIRKDYLNCEYYGSLLLSHEKLVPKPILESVNACLICVRDLLSPIAINKLFIINNRPFKASSVRSKVVGGNITVEYSSWIPHYLQQFYSSYSRVIRDSQHINWRNIFEQVKRRDKYLSTFESRSYDQLSDVGRKFREDIKVAFSKQTLV